MIGVSRHISSYGQNKRPTKQLSMDTSDVQIADQGLAYTVKNGRDNRELSPIPDQEQDARY